MSEKVD